MFKKATVVQGVDTVFNVMQDFLEDVRLTQNASSAYNPTRKTNTLIESTQTTRGLFLSAEVAEARRELRGVAEIGDFKILIKASTITIPVNTDLTIIRVKNGIKYSVIEARIDPEALCTLCL